MRILAIETSCDDTGIAILDVKNKKFTVLSNIVSSQKIHKKYGGVFPMMAKREHQANLVPVLMQSLKLAKLLNSPDDKHRVSGVSHRAKFKIVEKILERESELLKQLQPFLKKYKKPDIDLIAVTHGPGLEPCLWVGVNFARVLSYVWDIPLIPVNHIEAHILVNFLSTRSDLVDRFPAVALVVSGGHTQLILMNGVGKYKIIGETRDDAAGECFDKCAKILGLGYPGGPIISQLAKELKKDIYLQNRRSSTLQVQLPRPMIRTKDYDFSFSGLKTAVLYLHKDLKNKYFYTSKYRSIVKELCWEIQQAIIDVLVKKTIKAVKDFNAKTIILGGGVSANDELRKQLKEKIQSDMPNTQYLIPDTALSTDNALMIAVAGYFHRSDTKDWQKIKANANLRIS